ncbi:MAG: hypothetical protein WC782_03925 [Methylococcaceae bacterium]|jgi:hypothetical protein
MKRNYLVLTALCGSLSCQASDYIFQPSFSATERYDDNFRLQARPSGSNFISTISPAIKFGYLQETGDLNANFKLNQLFYSNEPRLEATEKLFDSQYSFAGERYNFSLAGNYSIQSSINTELEPTGSGILLNVNAFRTNRSISPSFSYRLTEKNSLQLSYSYSDSAFDNTVRNANIRGFKSQALSSSLSHQFSPRQSVSLSASYSLFDSASNQNSTSISVQAGWQYSLNEKTQLGLSVGRRSTDTESFGGRFRSTSNGQIFSANISRTTEWGNLSFNAGQQLNPATTGQQQQSTTFSASASYNINERLSSSISANYLQNQAAGGSTSSSRTLTSFSPNLNWRWTEEIRLGLSYNYRQQAFQSQNTDAVGNSVQLQFSYQPQTNRQVK